MNEFTPVEIATAVEQIRATHSDVLAKRVELGGEAWWGLAHCTDANPDLFFLKPGESGDAAKAICAECVVIKPCLEFALKFATPGQRKNTNVVLGGMTHEERTKVLLDRMRRR